MIHLIHLLFAHFTIVIYLLTVREVRGTFVMGPIVFWTIVLLLIFLGRALVLFVEGEPKILLCLSGQSECVICSNHDTVDRFAHRCLVRYWHHWGLKVLLSTSLLGKSCFAI